MLFSKKMQTKQTIILLPGWGFRTSIWQPIIPFLSKHFKIINLPLPKINFNYTNNQKALDKTTALIHTKIPDNSIIMGWSLGGMLGSYLASQYPHKCRKLITVCSTPRFLTGTNWIGHTPVEVNAFIDSLTKNPKRQLLQFVKRVSYPITKTLIKQEIITHILDEYNDLLFYLNLLAQTDIREYYYNLPMPSLHILGSLDIITKHEASTHGHNLKVIDKAGHLPFWSHSQEFLQILSFIKEM